MEKGKETIIKTVKYAKEYETKFGIMHQFYVTYDDKNASFSCKNKDNPPFKAGEKYMFTEIEKEYKGIIYFNIKPIKKEYGGYNKAVKREQSKYSGFAMSYAKDLVIADKIELKQISEYTKKMFELMVSLDKNLEI